MSNQLCSDLVHCIQIKPANPEQSSAVPFINHSQLTVITDTLIRRLTHHALLETSLPSDIQACFIEALLAHIRQDNINYKVSQADMYYFDFVTTQPSLSLISNEFKLIQQDAAHKNRHAIICINTDINQIDCQYLLNAFIHTNNLRFIVFSPAIEQTNSLTDHFSLIKLNALKENDVLNLIKQQSGALAIFHDIIISEDVLEEAYQLAKRYLSCGEVVKNSVLLLDSSAARTSSHRTHALNESTPVKPVLTSETLYKVLSSWTNIPKSHLPLNKFASGDFTRALQQRIFGQDIAINTICQTLQHAHAGLQTNNATFASLLLPGPRYTGKKTTAISLSSHLFGHLNALYFAQLTRGQMALADIKVQRQADKQYLPLKKAIEQTPYAIFLFEGIEQAEANIINELTDIVSTGLLHNKDGEQYSFSQAILLFSTACGSAQLNTLFAPQPAKEAIDQLDLMQLVLSKQPVEKPVADGFTSEAIVSKIIDDIKEAIPASLLQHLAIAPFLPISRSGIEKIIHLKLKDISAHLESRYQINFSYAPEVIRFVAEESILSQNNEEANNIDHALEQLYLSIEQTILFNERRSNRPRQLFLQLNETGEALRCHWLEDAAMS